MEKPLKLRGQSVGGEVKGLEEKWRTFEK